MEEEAQWPNDNAIDPDWGAVHCVRTLKVLLLTQLYKWILITERGEVGGGGVGAEVT